jgi:predicted flap endonuclease-1-like 5' DNA nuclease
MLTLIAKIFLCLLVAATLGVLMGWWARQRLVRAQLNDVRLSSQRTLADERSRFARLDDEMLLVQRQYEQQTTRSSHLAEQVESLKTQLETALQTPPMPAIDPVKVQELAFAKAAAAKATSDLERMATRLVEIDKRFTARTLEMDALTGELERLRAMPAATPALDPKQLESYETEKTQSTLRAADAERRLEDATLEFQQQWEKLQNAHAAEMERAASQLNVRSADNERILGELNEVRAEFAALRVHAAQKEELLDRAGSERETLRQQMESAQSELGEREANLSQLQMRVANHEFELAAVRNESKVQDAQFADLSASLQARVGEVERLRGELIRREQTLQERQTILLQYEREVAGLMAQRERHQEELAEVAQVSDNTIEELRRKAFLAEEETQRAAETWKEATEAEEKARADAKRVRGEMDAAVQQRQGLQLQLDTLRADTSELKNDYEARLASLSKQLEDIKRRPPVLPAWGAPRPKEIDDLQLIWGVGPKLEKLLHSLGIWTFRQVASWTKKDIVEIDTRLEVFHGRIDRDGWVASAKSEHMKKYEEKL